MSEEKKEPTFPDPPSHLSEKASELYRFYVGLTVKSPGQIELFIKGLEALDQGDEAARIIREEGLTQISERSGMSRQHPAIAIQKEAIACFLKIWKILELNLNAYQDGFQSKNYID